MNPKPRFNATAQLEVADTLTRLWEGLFPNFETPSRTQFLTWAAMASESTAAYSFNRAASKSRRQSMTSDEIGRYISGIMRNEREGRHTFPQKENQPVNDNDNKTTLNPTTSQLLEAVCALEPSASRDTAVSLLEAGMVNADSSIGDLKTALDNYYVPSTPAAEMNSLTEETA